LSSADRHVAPFDQTARKRMTAEEMRQKREQDSRRQEADRGEERDGQALDGDFREQEARSPDQINGAQGQRQLCPIAGIVHGILRRG
jgi:hypothetical protein